MREDTGEDYVGRVVAGKYRVESMLGEGGMGRVFRATQLTLDKPVVLKVLRQNLLSDERTVARFQREAKAASRLNHPNSISVLDFGQDESGALYIAMEYVAGRDLHYILTREWPLPEARTVRIVSQVLSALADAHRAGVIHRDLKPENIMVEPRHGGEVDFVKVLDFGIAKIQEAEGEEGQPLTRAGFVCGTPEYMSPEQARGMGLDQRSDLYAVGVILYQLTSGMLPFEADSAVGLATKHLTELPRPPSMRRGDLTLSAAMERLILKALSKSPADRPQTADAFKAELSAVDREREAEHAHRLGFGSPILAPLPTHGGVPYASPSTDSAVKVSPAVMDALPAWGATGGSPEDTATEPAEGPQSRATQKALLSLPPNPSMPLEPLASAAAPAPDRSLRLWRVTAALLVAGTVAAVGLVAMGAFEREAKPSEKSRSTGLQAPLTSPAPEQSAAPLFGQAIPPEDWRPEEARQKALDADAALARGELAAARQGYQEAFAAKPEPDYSLKLGALYFEDRKLSSEERDKGARGWWLRHLQDDPEPGCKARKHILAAYPELANDPSLPAVDRDPP